MEDKLREKVKKILKEKEVDGFLGLRLNLNHPQPYLFTDIEELEYLSLTEVKYPWVKIYLKIKNFYQDKKFALLVRGCDERHLLELHKNKQININEVLLIGINCSLELAKKCECEKPYVRIAKIVFGDKLEPEEIKISENKEISYWLEKFSRCIKCYGCRYICPMCFCNSCSLEEDLLVKRGYLPVDYPLFHLVRAYHLAGRCIECGLCEETCPSEIPLRKLYGNISKKFSEIFGYKPGESMEEKSPLEFLPEEIPK